VKSLAVLGPAILLVASLFQCCPSGALEEPSVQAPTRGAATPPGQPRPEETPPPPPAEPTRTPPSAPTAVPAPTDTPTPGGTATPEPTPIQMPTLPAPRVPIAYFADTCMFPSNISESVELDGTIRFEWIVAPPGSTINLFIYRASDGAYVGPIVSNGQSIGEIEIEIGAGIYQIMAVCEEAVFDITITKAGE
jgi:hypothetical protein